MRRNEWLVACAVAGLVILAMVAAGLPPMTWAAPEAAALPAVVVPALPPAALDIPALEAKVSAIANPDPGKPVKVKLTVTAPPAKAGESVPVTLTVLGTSQNLMSRRAPSVSEAKQVARTDVSIQIGQDGTGSAVVDLPLVWAQPTGPTTQPASAARPALLAAMMRTTYQMVLTSPLVKGRTTAAQLLTQAGGAVQSGNLVQLPTVKGGVNLANTVQSQGE